MMKYIIALISIVMVAILVSFVQRRYKGMRYAIQNAKTGKNLRPFAAGKQNDNRLVQYDHHSWKCMTWDFEEVGFQTYLIKNRYTSKTFQTSGEPWANSRLFQQELIGGSSQQWELIRQTEDAYRIKLKGTNLFISVSSDKANSDIVLLPFQEDDAQLWKLVKQNPLL